MTVSARCRTTVGETADFGQALLLFGIVAGEGLQLRARGRHPFGAYTVEL